jgi:hypothetical protein
LIFDTCRRMRGVRNQRSSPAPAAGGSMGVSISATAPFLNAIG